MNWIKVKESWSKRILRRLGVRTKSMRAHDAEMAKLFTGEIGTWRGGRIWIHKPARRGKRQ